MPNKAAEMAMENMVAEALEREEMDGAFAAAFYDATDTYLARNTSKSPRLSFVEFTSLVRNLEADRDGVGGVGPAAIIPLSTNTTKMMRDLIKVKSRMYFTMPEPSNDGVQINEFATWLESNTDAHKLDLFGITPPLKMCVDIVRAMICNLDNLIVSLNELEWAEGDDADHISDMGETKDSGQWEPEDFADYPGCA